MQGMCECKCGGFAPCAPKPARRCCSSRCTAPKPAMAATHPPPHSPTSPPHGWMATAPGRPSRSGAQLRRLSPPQQQHRQPWRQQPQEQRHRQPQQLLQQPPACLLRPSHPSAQLELLTRGGVARARQAPATPPPPAPPLPPGRRRRPCPWRHGCAGGCAARHTRRHHHDQRHHSRPPGGAQGMPWGRRGCCQRWPACQPPGCAARRGWWRARRVQAAWRRDPISSRAQAVVPHQSRPRRAAAAAAPSRPGCPLCRGPAGCGRCHMPRPDRPWRRALQPAVHPDALPALATAPPTRCLPAVAPPHGRRCARAVWRQRAVRAARATQPAGCAL